MNQFTIQCAWCDKPFTTKQSSANYCSREHKERAKQHRRNVIRRQLVDSQKSKSYCPNCETIFITNKANKIYCSDKCARENRKKRVDERDRQYNNARTPSFKARIYWHSYGTCQICHTHIDIRIQYPNPMSFSIDHIKPRSLGGSHAFYNLQAAHLVCNLRKGEKFDVEHG